MSDVARCVAGALLVAAPMTASAELSERAQRLQRDVQVLAGKIGDRQVERYDQLLRAADYITAQFEAAGYTVDSQPYQAAGRTVANLIATRPGTAPDREPILVGAHYDTCANPGADDNASGAAGLLELARALRTRPTPRAVRFVAFANEEPPFFQTPAMGSHVYVHQLAGPRPAAVVILEMIGYYTKGPHSQRYPPLLGWGRPQTGDYIGVVGNLPSARLVRRVREGLTRHGRVPVQAIAAPEFIDGVAWSDQWAFWRAHIPAVMVTDTAFFRNPHYHDATDTPETLDYTTMAAVVDALIGTVADLATSR